MLTLPLWLLKVPGFNIFFYVYHTEYLFPLLGILPAWEQLTFDLNDFNMLPQMKFAKLQLIEKVRNHGFHHNY